MNTNAVLMQDGGLWSRLLILLILNQILQLILPNRCIINARWQWAAPWASAFALGVGVIFGKFNANCEIEITKNYAVVYVACAWCSLTKHKRAGCWYWLCLLFQICLRFAFAFWFWVLAFAFASETAIYGTCNTKWQRATKQQSKTMTKKQAPAISTAPAPYAASASAFGRSWSLFAGRPLPLCVSLCVLLCFGVLRRKEAAHDDQVYLLAK
jgi:hypothetical protein